MRCRMSEKSAMRPSKTPAFLAIYYLLKMAKTLIREIKKASAMRWPFLFGNQPDVGSQNR